MIGRRRFLAGGVCAAVAVRGSAGLAVTSEAARLRRVLDGIYEQRLASSPEDMSGLGLDVGPGAWARSRLDDQSEAGRRRRLANDKGWLVELAAFDRASLATADRISLDCVRYDVARRISLESDFGYGRPGFPQPYVLSQIGGTYQSVPDFLASQHVVATVADAESYLARLEGFARCMDDETKRTAADAARGLVPPDFVIDRTLGQMRSLRLVDAAESGLVRSLTDRTDAKAIAGDWAARATRVVESSVWPALDRQIGLLRRWRGEARHKAGVGHLPRGQDYYREALRYQTTTTLTPDDVHHIGLELVTRIGAQAEAAFRRQGLTGGSIGSRYTALFRDPRFLYPNTDAGKRELVAYLNGRVSAVSSRLAAYFGRLPRTGLVVRRIPPANEAGAPPGYYEDGSLDGSRPGAYYINLRDTAEVPKWLLPTLTYHEGVPGHHLQGAVALEAADLPMIRRTLWFTGYGEGWALYAEQLADEMALYEDDPWGHLGYLHDSMWRAVRLVLDTGLHAKGWSRERAIAYMLAQIGGPPSVAASEVERYCVWPGQACSYMIGKLSWLKAREQARARLGKRFDIRRFHDVALATGTMPLEVFESYMAGALT